MRFRKPERIRPVELRRRDRSSRRSDNYESLLCVNCSSKEPCQGQDVLLRHEHADSVRLRAVSRVTDNVCLHSVVQQPSGADSARSMRAVPLQVVFVAAEGLLTKVTAITDRFARTNPAGVQPASWSGLDAALGSSPTMPLCVRVPVRMTGAVFPSVALPCRTWLQADTHTA